MADDPNALVTAVYNQAKLQGDSDQLAYNKALSALQESAAMATQYGQSFGTYTDLNQVAANAPPKGTPTLTAGEQTGSIGYIPGYTGVDAGQTAGLLSGQANTAQGAAGLTGWYTAPRQSAYTPGTFLRIDPNTYDHNTYGDQLDYVLSSGQIQRVTLPQARAMGWNGDLGSLNVIPFGTAATLESAPPTNLPQQTLQSLSQYSNLNSAAINQAIAQSGATGMYSAPATVQPPGTNWSGGKFSDIPADQQQAYYYAHGGDWQAAMNAWVADTNAAIQQAGGGPPQAGTPQETLQAQQQYFTQANTLANAYGQYYAPNTPGGAYQAGVNGPQQGQLTLTNINQQNAIKQAWAQQYGYVPDFDANGQPIFQAGANGQPATTLAAQQQAYNQWLDSLKQSDVEWQQQQTASQNYLTLLSNLRGPADWAQYQKVLGATPQGTRDLVAAAAGQYIPGGGATTGVAPQAASLQSLYSQATGQQGTSSQQDLTNMQNTLVAPNQMAPQTWNALTPSQQQMLLGVWESQGYSQDDAKALFQQSLPKYATSATGLGGGAGTFKLQ